MAIPGSTDPTTTIAELDIQLAELSARALSLGASPEEVTFLGGIVATPNPISNPILAQAETASAKANPTGPDSIQDTRKVIEEVSKSSQEARASIQANVLATSEASEAIQGSLGDIASADRMVRELSLVADMSAQKATLATFEALGGQEAQIALATQFKEEGDRASALLDERTDIMNDEHTGITLIDTIVNGFRSIQTEIELESAQLEQAQTLSQIQGATSITEGAASANILTKQTITDASIEASLKSVSAESSIKAKDIEIKNLHNNSVALQQSMAADERTISNKLQLVQLENSAEARDAAREARKLQREKMEIQRQTLPLELDNLKKQNTILTERLKEITDPKRKAQVQAQFDENARQLAATNAARADMVEDVQRGQDVLFGRHEEADTVDLKLDSPASVEKYFKFQELGSMAKPTLGEDPFEARQTYKELDPENLSPRTKGKRMLEAVEVKLAEKLKKLGAGKLPKDEAGLKVLYNKLAIDLSDDWHDEIKTGDTSNPLHAAPMATLVTYDTVANDKFFKTSVKQRAMQEVNPEKLLDLAITESIAGSITLEEGLAGIVKILEAAEDYNNTMQGGGTRVGFPGQFQYNVRVPRVPTFFEQMLQKTEKGIFAPLAALDEAIFGETPEFPGPNLSGITAAVSALAVSPTVLIDFKDIIALREHAVKLRSAVAVEPRSAEPSTTPTVSPTVSPTE